MPDSGGRWINYAYSFNFNGGSVNPTPISTWGSKYYTYGSDTLINNLSYFKIKEGSWYAGAMRKDSGRVFYVPYNFSMVNADTT